MKVYLFILLLVITQYGVADTIPYGYNTTVGRYFDAGNKTMLYYEIYGEGEPLLLLHGGVYGYIDEFKNLIPKLAEKYQVICQASRGHVKSDIGHEPFTYEQRAEDAYALIQHLGIAKVTVVGFSDGALAAYKLAAIHPSVIRKVIAMGAGEIPPHKKPGNSTLSAAQLLKDHPDFFQPRVANMREPDRWNESLTMMNSLYNSSFLSSETFSKIQSPTLVMSGDGDEYFSPESTLVAHRAIANSQLAIIPGCGHVILDCNFSAVWASLKPFLEKK